MFKLREILAGCIGYLAVLSMQPAEAGRLLGDHASKYNDYRVKAASNLYTTDSAGLLLLSNGTQYAPCSSVLISKYYALTSAHCFTGAKINAPTSARFASIWGDSFVTSYTIHKSFDRNGVYWNDLTQSNTPRQATYDIALIRLSQNMEDLGMKPVSLPTAAPTSPFTGSFTGFGQQGNGESQVICNISCTTAANLTDLVSESYLGGENTINDFGTFFVSDFDDGSFLRNIDGSAVLPFEYAPDIGDSGAGLFDASGNLVGLVSGGGYGTRVRPVTFDVLKYAPVSYGSLSIYTPLHLHTGWLTNMMKADPFPSTTIPIGTTPNALTEVPFNPSGGLSGESISIFIGSLFGEGLIEINDVFSEVFSQEVYDEIYGTSTPLTPPQESVPGPFSVLGVVTAFGTSRRIRKRIREARSMRNS